MLAATALIGINRLGNWLAQSGFTPRGRYEDADRMGGQGRIADWIEASCLVDLNGRVSKTEVLDHLMDSGMVTDQHDAEIVADAGFAELHLRYQLITPHPIFGFPFELQPNLLTRSFDWDQYPLYLFLLFCSMGQLEPWLIKTGSSYNEVGHLFEDLVVHAAQGLLGRPADKLAVSGTGTTLSTRIAALLAQFARSPLAAASSAPQRIKDGGLDVVARLGIGDMRPGSAHFLIQCAVGLDWWDKLAAPPLEKWRQWVGWRGPIYRALALPLLLADDQVLEDASSQGEWTLLLDRARILDGLARLDDIPSSWMAIVCDWCDERIRELANAGHIV